MMMNLPCLRGSCPNFLRSIYHSLSASQAPKRGHAPRKKTMPATALVFMFDCYWPAFTCRGTDLLSGRYTISGSCWSFADAVRSGLHTILRLHGLHPFHPLIPHFSLHSSRFNWLYCNHVLLVLHYARYFSCHSLKRKWQPSQAGISYRWTARWNNKRWYGFLCGLLRWISVSGGNVVNLSPKALIFQGYRALFFLKNFWFFFLKKTWQKPPKVRSLCDLLIKGNVVAATNLITLRRYVLWIEPTYAKISFNP